MEEPAEQLVLARHVAVGNVQRAQSPEILEESD